MLWEVLVKENARLLCFLMCSDLLSCVASKCNPDVHGNLTLHVVYCIVIPVPLFSCTVLHWRCFASCTWFLQHRDTNTVCYTYCTLHSVQFTSTVHCKYCVQCTKLLQPSVPWTTYWFVAFVLSFAGERRGWSYNFAIRPLYLLEKASIIFLLIESIAVLLSPLCFVVGHWSPARILLERVVLLHVVPYR
jgi:hypothetical protein